jgi:hypothetical protein
MKTLKYILLKIVIIVLVVVAGYNAWSLVHAMNTHNPMDMLWSIAISLSGNTRSRSNNAVGYLGSPFFQRTYRLHRRSVPPRQTALIVKRQL